MNGANPCIDPSCPFKHPFPFGVTTIGVQFGGDTEEDDDSALDQDLIPGDNDKPSPTENAPGVPDNLGKIPAQSGDGSIFAVPIELEPPKP